MMNEAKYVLIWIGWLVLITRTPAEEPYVIAPEKKDHWAWRPLASPRLPTVKDANWVRNPIDAFILQRLEAAGLKPTPPAPPETLLRRVTLDLTGLPPTVAEVEAFVADPSPAAWERVVERLLASPAYGERWGRHWLDLARYADSNGYEHDEIRPDAWRYRDYVIRAFNDDKPYDRVVREQLAGDELYPDDPDALIATGFNLLGPDMTDAADAKQRRQNTLNDMTDTAGLVFLGLTVGCARCHDHKFEPIPQADYYRLQSFFTPAAFRMDVPIAAAKQRRAHAAATAAYRERVHPTQEALAKIEEPYRKRLHAERLAKLSDEARAAHQTPPDQRTAAQREVVEKTTRLLTVTPQAVVNAMTAADRAEHQRLTAQLRRFDAHKPAPLPGAMGLQENGKEPPKTYILDRGELTQPGAAVEPGFPVILEADHRSTPAPVQPPRPGTSGRRSALAAWVTRPDHPLTARVLVNRLWQHHFGRGIVPTPSDFGVRGQPPTHPELLDWLATAFVRSGWSVKHLHRLMLTSATYRQSSLATPETLRADPDNLLFSRRQRVRLEGEILRDALLAVSGRLNRQMGGPGVFPPIPPEALAGFKGWPTSADARDHHRRSVYVFARRNLRFPFLEAFDAPDSNLSCPQRERSTTAPQALALFNAADVLDAAAATAEMIDTQGDAVTQAYRLILGRTPTDAERELSRQFLARAPLRELCRALFNLNEFVYAE